MTPTDLFGYASIAFMLLSRGIYLNSLRLGKTRPHAFSWLIWCTVSTIGFAAQWIDGAGAGAWARGFGAFTGYIIVFFAFSRGEKNITRADWITLTIALLTIPLWMLTNNALYSVIIVCIIDTLGYIPTVRKSWSRPQHEPASGYAISGMAAFCSILAIEHYAPTTWLYSAVLTISNFALVALLLLRRQVLKKAIVAACLALLVVTTALPTAANAQEVEIRRERPMKINRVTSSLLPDDMAAPADIRHMKAAKIEVYKSERRMDLLDQNGNPIRSYMVSLGKMPEGDKRKEGDNKTPEGKYIIESRNDKSDYHLSLRISYPNASDKYRASKAGVKPGGAIMIHGMPNGQSWKTWKYNKTKDWTNGCIAVYNDEIREIWNLVDNGTPIIIRP